MSITMGVVSMKIKNHLIPIIMLLQVTVATVLLIIAITDNAGLIKYVYSSSFNTYYHG
jgi:hypothetical protein